MKSWNRGIWIWPLAAAGLFSSACTVEIIEGSGNSASEVRELPDFRSVSNASVIDVELSVGEEQWVEITCDDNLLELLRTRVEDGELKIYQPTVVDEPNHFVSLEPRTDCRAELVTPLVTAVRNSGSGQLRADGPLDTLNAVQATGSGKVSLAGIDVSRLDLELDGSGDVELSGAAATVNVDSNGSGKTLARDLQVREARVVVNGSGDVELAVSGAVDIDINGSGDVIIFGRPDSCRVSTPGSGHVVFK